MRIGIPREVKVREHRVACTPIGVRMLVQAGHQVLIEAGAGAGSGFPDEQYRAAGATLVPTAADAWSADLVFKIKEPIPSEYPFLRNGLLLFTYLHLAANRPLTDRLLETRTIGLAYETVQVGRRRPLLEPMSEIAGRMSTIVGAYYLSKAQGGKGVLLGDVPGVPPGKVLVVGGGTAGTNAARMAVGLGAEATILEVDAERRRALDVAFRGAVRTFPSNEQDLTQALPGADLLVGTVSVPGARAPRLITRAMLRGMSPGSVFVDVAIDQGGCAETSHPTTHEDPVYVDEGVIHYGVTNMPAAYARTATQALATVTLPYAMNLANLGFGDALRQYSELRTGVNTWEGRIFCPGVAEAHGLSLAQLPA